MKQFLLLLQLVNGRDHLARFQNEVFWESLFNDVNGNKDCETLFPSFGISERKHAAGHAARIAICQAPYDLAYNIASIGRDYALKAINLDEEQRRMLRREVQLNLDIRRKVYWETTEHALPGLLPRVTEIVAAARKEIDDQLIALVTAQAAEMWNNNDELVNHLAYYAQTISIKRQYIQWATAVLDTASTCTQVSEIRLSDTFHGSREGVITHLLNQIDADKRILNFAEIGVHNADFSVNIMSQFPLLNYIGVDPYKYDDDLPTESTERQLMEIGVTANSLQELGRNSSSKYENMNNVPGRTGRAELKIMRSLEAATQIEPNSLDGVFIDGDHSYKAAKEDILAWEPLVKPGGFIAGHDFGTHDDVIRAVCEHRDAQPLHL